MYEGIMQSLHCVLQKYVTVPNACEWKLLQHCGKKRKISGQQAENK